MNTFHSLLFLWICGLAIVTSTSCSNNDDNVAPGNESPNILLIIADDLGKDAIKGYSEGALKPTTPHIDRIRNSGLTFHNFWVNPICTPTRASIITGKYGYRTGMKSVSDVLNTNETVIQKYIKDQTNGKYASALIGKWHLSGNNANFNPEQFGIDYYAGLIKGVADDYYQWQFSEDGSVSLQTKYTTEVFTDLSIQWINAQSKPWFLWLAYNAPHAPFHIPPAEMHTQGNLPVFTQGMDPIPYNLAAIEAIDYQIGRLLDSIPENERNNTIIIFIGDNGTPNQVAQSPYTSSTVKNTLFQGGINVPMFISGPEVSRIGSDTNLVCGTDLFATLAEISGINIPEYNDSKSFKSLFTQSKQIRKFLYSEMNDGTLDSWTISNGSYKLIENANGDKAFYHLTNDPYEKVDLLNGVLSPFEEIIKLELEQELKNIRR